MRVILWVKKIERGICEELFFVEKILIFGEIIYLFYLLAITALQYGKSLEYLPFLW